MKRIKFYMLLSALFCAFSCGDKELPDVFNHALEGKYPNTEIGNELILVYNGDTLTGKQVDVNFLGTKRGVLTFENVIQGETKTELTVDFIESINPDNNHITGHLFEGVYSTKSLSIRYSGFLEAWLLSLELNEQ